MLENVKIVLEKNVYFAAVLGLCEWQKPVSTKSENAAFGRSVG